MSSSLTPIGGRPDGANVEIHFSPDFTHQTAQPYNLMGEVVRRPVDAEVGANIGQRAMEDVEASAVNDEVAQTIESLRARVVELETQLRTAGVEYKPASSPAEEPEVRVSSTSSTHSEQSDDARELSHHEKIVTDNSKAMEVIIKLVTATPRLAPEDRRRYEDPNVGGVIRGRSRMSMEEWTNTKNRLEGLGCIAFEKSYDRRSSAVIVDPLKIQEAVEKGALLLSTDHEEIVAQMIDEIGGPEAVPAETRESRSDSTLLSGDSPQTDTGTRELSRDEKREAAKARHTHALEVILSFVDDRGRYEHENAGGVIRQACRMKMGDWANTKSRLEWLECVTFEKGRDPKRSTAVIVHLDKIREAIEKGALLPIDLEEITSKITGEAVPQDTVSTKPHEPAAETVAAQEASPDPSSPKPRPQSNGSSQTHTISPRVRRGMVLDGEGRSASTAMADTAPEQRTRNVIIELPTFGDLAKFTREDWYALPPEIRLALAVDHESVRNGNFREGLDAWRAAVEIAYISEGRKQRFTDDDIRELLKPLIPRIKSPGSPIGDIITYDKTTRKLSITDVGREHLASKIRETLREVDQIRAMARAQ